MDKWRGRVDAQSYEILTPPSSLQIFQPKSAFTWISQKFNTRCRVGNMARQYCTSSKSLLLDISFFHHYQGSIDFNTVNIHRTVGMYFLISTGNRGDIEWHDLQRSYYPIHSLLPGVYVSILSLGTVFPRTLPWANIRNTSSRGKHWQCSSYDADKLNPEKSEGLRKQDGLAGWERVQQIGDMSLDKWAAQIESPICWTLSICPDWGASGGRP